MAPVILKVDQCPCGFNPTEELQVELLKKATTPGAAESKCPDCGRLLQVVVGDIPPAPAEAAVPPTPAVE